MDLMRLAPRVEGQTTFDRDGESCLNALIITALLYYLFEFSYFLALPLRTTDDSAEVHALELWILVRQYICLHIAECRLRPVLDAVIKGLDNVFFKVLGARIRGDDRFAISVGEFRISDSENIHLDTVGQQRNHRMHVLGNSRRSV